MASQDDIAARFAARAAELEALHRSSRPGSLARALERGLGASWVYRWARGLLSAPRASTRPRRPVPDAAPGECVVSWLGHATALVRYAHARILTDPCLADSLYTLRRVKAAVIPPGALEGLDLVLISHAHADHLHLPSLRQLDRRLTAVVPAGVSQLDRVGFARVHELQPGERLELFGVTVTAVAARHAVGASGGGLALAYVIEGDGPTVFFAGDTGYAPLFLEVGERHRPDVALLPISGYQPRSLRRDHLSPLDALHAFEDLDAQLLLPIHHFAFPLGYEAPGEPIAWLRSLAEARGRAFEGRVGWLEPGDSCIARRSPLPRSAPAASLAGVGGTH